MAYGWYTKEEIETIVNYNLGDKYAISVSTAQPAVMRAMEKAGIKPRTEHKQRGRIANRTYLVNGRKHRITISNGWFRVGAKKKGRKGVRPGFKKSKRVH